MRRGLFDSEPAPAAGYARIAVERAIDQHPEGLTYIIPDALADLRIGERVTVPLGTSNRPTSGYVIARDDAASPEIEVARLKPIISRDDLPLHLPPALVDLAQWISSYYCAPIGMTLASMLPAAVRKRTGLIVKRFVDLAPNADAIIAGKAAAAADTEPSSARTLRLSPRQRDILNALQNLAPESRPIEMRALADLAGARTLQPIKRLIEAGLLHVDTRSSIEAKWRTHARDASEPQHLTTAQAAALQPLAAAIGQGFSRHLLFGVTGSGKTEVYIRLIRRCIELGRTAIMLVPEIALTPQTGGRLLGRFPDQKVAILHSALTSAQRNQQWSLVQQGTARIVLGARSAVFAPVADEQIGLIIVDEEHDSSYKQDRAPRYHGRDVAIRRAQVADCPIVLGSATPSLESWHNVHQNTDGRWLLHCLPERVTGMQLPKVQIVDLAQERRRRQRDHRVHLLGPALEDALRQTLADGGQALLLLNRRGYANYTCCPDHHCGWLMTCDQCDVTMVYHINRQLPRGGYVRCHHCQSQQRLPQQCPTCRKQVNTFGLGTQRVEAELQSKFDQLIEGQTMLRVDSDTMHTARDFHDALDRFGSGALRVLVGTQMIAKGLDFPNVRLVGVINADTSINLPDFRATERTFQLVSQVSGRSGRGEPGRVIVQTFQPHLPAITLAAQHDYQAFATNELEERCEANLPPHSRMVRIITRDADLTRCIELAATLARQLQGPAANAGVTLTGPAPCAIARIAGRFRHELMLIGPTARAVQHVLAEARSMGAIHPDASMAIDVDPVSVV